MPACAPRRLPASPPRSKKQNRGSPMHNRSSIVPPTSPAATTPRSKRSIRPRTTLRAHAATPRPDAREPKPTQGGGVAARTKEERAIADTQVAAAAAALAVLERRLEKTILRAPADGVVSVIVAEVGENIRAGQPVLAIE